VSVRAERAEEQFEVVELVEAESGRYREAGPQRNE
jgi:hypothetical protein